MVLCITYCRRALDIIDPIFIEMCIKEQNMLGTEEGIEKFLPILPNEEDRQEMKALFNRESTSEARWQAFVQYIESKRTEVQLYTIYFTHDIAYILNRNI